MSDSMEDRIKALEDALTLAANRLQRISLDFDTGSRRFFEVVEWVDSAHATLAASQSAPGCHQPDLATADSSQPAQPVAVKIKPLVWDKFDDECYSWKAPLFGSVLVKRHWKGFWVVVWSTPGYTELFAHGHFPTPHEAKAAAEARIMAALDVQPLTVQDAAASDVLAERTRQISAEGWTPAHDDAHFDGAIARAAASYALSSAGYPHLGMDVWPWSHDWWKPADRRRDLVKAGALILAEIERLDRAALRAIAEGRA